jgi:hypothetical protein
MIMPVTIIIPSIIIIVPPVAEIKIENHRGIPAIIRRIPAAIIVRRIKRIIAPVASIIWIISVIAPVSVIISQAETYSP